MRSRVKMTKEREAELIALEKRQRKILAEMGIHTREQLKEAKKKAWEDIAFGLSLLTTPIPEELKTERMKQRDREREEEKRGLR